MSRWKVSILRIEICYGFVNEFSLVMNREHNPHGKVVSISEFRNLLINLFAISILWVHFDHAKNWGEGHDIDSKLLDREQFAMAYKTLIATEAHEEVSESQIDEDFALLDKSGRGLVGFMEVCQHCSIYLHSSSDGDAKEKASKLLGINRHTDDTMKDLLSGPRQYYDGANSAEKTDRAVDALAAKLDDIKEIAKKVEEQITQKLNPESSFEGEMNFTLPSASSEQQNSAPKTARKSDVDINATQVETQSPKSVNQISQVDPIEVKSTPRISQSQVVSEINIQITKSPRALTPYLDQRASPPGNASPINSSRGKLSPTKSMKIAQGFSSSKLAQVAEI